MSEKPMTRAELEQALEGLYMSGAETRLAYERPILAALDALTADLTKVAAERDALVAGLETAMEGVYVDRTANPTHPADKLRDLVVKHAKLREEQSTPDAGADRPKKMRRTGQVLGGFNDDPTRPPQPLVFVEEEAPEEPGDLSKLSPPKVVSTLTSKSGNQYATAEQLAELRKDTDRAIAKLRAEVGVELRVLADMIRVEKLADRLRGGK